MNEPKCFSRNGWSRSRQRNIHDFRPIVTWNFWTMCGTMSHTTNPHTISTQNCNRRTSRMDYGLPMRRLDVIGPLNWGQMCLTIAFVFGSLFLHMDGRWWKISDAIHSQRIHNWKSHGKHHIEKSPTVKVLVTSPVPLPSHPWRLTIPEMTSSTKLRTEMERSKASSPCNK